MTELKSFILPSSHGLGGWGNGYVAIPKGHPAHGLEYDDIHEKWDIDVSGGLTFSCSLLELSSDHWGAADEIRKTQPDAWIVGFDTAHYGDNLFNWPEENVEAEAVRLLNQLAKIQS